MTSKEHVARVGCFSFWLKEGPSQFQNTVPFVVKYIVNNRKKKVSSFPRETDPKRISRRQKNLAMKKKKKKKKTTNVELQLI